jgi:molybdate/tungstate transport system permease protein
MAPKINTVFSLLSGLLLLFVISPLLGMFFATPLSELFNVASDGEVQASIWLTLWISMATTLAFSILAIPLAYILARRSFPLKSIITGIIDLPIVIPHSAAGIAILGFISRDSALGKVASLLGLNLVGSPFAIGLAMAFVSIPFLVNAARNGFEAVPERLEKAALNLGASPSRVFLSISLPLAWRSIVSGLVMMFARGMSEFGAVVIVAYHPMVTPILIYDRFNTFGLKYAQPVAIIFIAVSLTVFIAFRLLASKKNRNA